VVLAVIGNRRNSNNPEAQRAASAAVLGSAFTLGAADRMASGAGDISPGRNDPAPRGRRSGPSVLFRTDGSRERVRLCSTTDVACREHHNQHQENEPAKTTPDCRAT
jgi:hypothetical protein